MATAASREGWLLRRARRDRRSSDRLGQVVILNWRDSWHPEGGGSEIYVREVATRLLNAETASRSSPPATPVRPAPRSATASATSAAAAI